jgi:hypothetical protein
MVYSNGAKEEQNRTRYLYQPKSDEMIPATASKIEMAVGCLEREPQYGNLALP